VNLSRLLLPGLTVILAACASAPERAPRATVEENARAYLKTAWTNQPVPSEIVSTEFRSDAAAAKGGAWRVTLAPPAKPKERPAPAAVIVLAPDGRALEMIPLAN
jgi:hypothetical protein